MVGVIPGGVDGKCRVCGCTDDDCGGCYERTGEPCYWVEADLCSACAAAMDVKQGGAAMGITGFLVNWPCGGCGNVLGAVLDFVSPERFDGTDRCEECGGPSEAGLVLEQLWNGALDRAEAGQMDINFAAAVVAQMIESSTDWLLFDPAPVESDPVKDLEGAMAVADIIIPAPFPWRS